MQKTKGTQHWDSKVIARRVLRLRIEAYNIFNHTEFSTIGTTLTLLGAVNSNTQYGQYTATLSPRQMSTTLRFEF
jgi:hypothetical protein